MPRKINLANQPIVVASNGRGGSTMVFNSIVNARIKQFKLSNIPMARWLFAKEKWTLKPPYRNFRVYKTHDFQCEISRNVKYIYLCSHPISSIISVYNLLTRSGYGPAWVKLHFKHLKSSSMDVNQLFQSDILNQIENIKFWKFLSKSRPNVLFIRYEEIWDYHKRIEDFINLKICLPKYQERSSSNKSISPHQLDELAKIFRGYEH